MALSAAQLAQMRYMSKSLMLDECTIKTRSNVQDDQGQPIASWTTLATKVSCGFEFSPFKFRAREIVAGGEGTSEILVRARLPITYYDSIDQEDRIVLTGRFGEDYTTEETYEIQGFAERGPSGLILNLKRVEP